MSNQFDIEDTSPENIERLQEIARLAFAMTEFVYTNAEGVYELGCCDGETFVDDRVRVVQHEDGCPWQRIQDIRHAGVQVRDEDNVPIEVAPKTKRGFGRRHYTEQPEWIPPHK